MLKVGFLLATGTDARDYGMPLAFGYLIAMLQREWGDRFAYRYTTEPYDLIEYQPDLVCIGSVTSCFGQAEAFAELLRSKMPGVVIMVGGHHISAVPHLLPEAMDVGVIGEGEDTFIDLCRTFEPGLGWRSDQLRKTPGICYHESRGRVSQTAGRPLRSDLDTLPMPVRTVNRTNPEEVHLSTSRGCPFRCVYCSARRHWKKHRRFSADYVVAEIRHIVETFPQVRSIHMVDDLYVADRQRLRDMATRIDRAGLNRCLSINGFVRSNLVDDELCALFRLMNVDAIRFGAESGSDAVLRRMDRGGKCSVATHQRAIDLAAANGFKCGASFMLGFPGETRDDLQKTIDFVHRNQSKLTIQGMYLAVPFPGTELWQWAAERGLVSETMDWRHLNVSFENPDFDWDAFLYLNDDALPRSEFVKMVCESGLLTRRVASRCLQDPHDRAAADRMLAVLANVAATGARRVALYGAGAHTLRIKDHLTHPPVEIVGILDDNEQRQGSHVGPFKIYHPRQLEQLDIDAVVLSSDEWEEQMWSRRDLFERQRVSVWRLYANEREAPDRSPCQAVNP